MERMGTSARASWEDYRAGSKSMQGRQSR